MGTLRLSLGRYTTETQIHKSSKIIGNIVTKIYNKQNNFPLKSKL